MGSAASSRRRWLAVSLLLAAVVGAVALWPGQDGDESPALGSRRSPDSEVIERSTSTVEVALVSGWSVPALPTVATAGSTVDIEAHGPPSLATGTETVGATVAISPDATMFIVHGLTVENSLTPALAYRTGTDGQWSSWSSVSVGPDEGPDAVAAPLSPLERDDGGGAAMPEGAGSRYPAVGPIWLESGSTEIEFVISGGAASSFDVTFLGAGRPDPGLGPAGAGVAERALAQAGGPPIVARQQWATLDWDFQNESCDEGPSVADHLKAVVIHHTVTSNNYAESDVPDLLRAINYSHVVLNGWCDIGYNFVVDRFGQIWEARTGSIERSIIGGHARGFNTSTVGVALLGQHQPGARPTASDVSPEAEAAVQALAHWKLGTEGVDPAGKTWLLNRSSDGPQRLAARSWHYMPTILGHRDLGLTSCPGSHGHDLVRSLPAKLAVQRDLALPYTFVDWRAHSHGPGFVVADSVGGVRPAGSSSPWSSAPAGLAVGESVVSVGGALSGGYLLSSSGTVIGFGSSPAIADKPAVGANAVDLVVRSDAQSGWVLDDTGTLHGFGGATTVDPGRTVAGSVAAALNDDGVGYVLDESGLLHPVGGAPRAAINERLPASVEAVDVDLAQGLIGTPTGWVLDETGRVHGFGGLASDRVTPPEAVVAVAAASSGPGGWVLDADGQLWPFQGARYVVPVSTNASAGNAVDIDNVGSVYSPSFLTGPDGRFIDSIYELFLGRDPTVVEVDFDVTALEQGSRRSDLTSIMARSDHWAGANVDQMYGDVLGRGADPEGRSYWLSELAGGMTIQELGTYFYGSSEYATRAGSTQSYVTGLYDVLLHRAPDDEGLRYWVGLLDSGQAQPPDVANGFFASIESRRDRAIALHRRVLQRDPDEDDLEYWSERLQSVGDVAVAAELAATSEFYNRAVDGPEP